MSSKKTAAAAQEALKPVEAAVNAGKETVEKVVKASTDAATKNYEQAVAMTKEQVEKASTAAFRGYDELVALNKDNLDAFVKSSNVMVKGYEAIGKEFMAFAQSSIDANVQATQAIFGAKTLREMIDLQAAYTRKNFDSAVAESSKIGELSVKVANEAFEPLQSRVNVAVESLLKPASV